MIKNDLISMEKNDDKRKLEENDLKLASGGKNYYSWGKKARDNDKRLSMKDYQAEKKTW